MALKWSHVDWYNKKLMIRETHHSSGEDGPVKTKNSIRDVDLLPATIEALRRQKKRTGLLGSYIFMTGAGKLEIKIASTTEAHIRDVAHRRGGEHHLDQPDAGAQEREDDLGTV
jgi:integrase